MPSAVYAQTPTPTASPTSAPTILLWDGSPSRNMRNWYRCIQFGETQTDMENMAPSCSTLDMIHADQTSTTFGGISHVLQPGGARNMYVNQFIVIPRYDYEGNEMFIEQMTLQCTVSHYYVSGSSAVAWIWNTAGTYGGFASVTKSHGNLTGTGAWATEDVVTFSAPGAWAREPDYVGPLPFYIDAQINMSPVNREAKQEWTCRLMFIEGMVWVPVITPTPVPTTDSFGTPWPTPINWVPVTDTVNMPEMGISPPVTGTCQTIVPGIVIDPEQLPEALPTGFGWLLTLLPIPEINTTPIEWCPVEYNIGMRFLGWDLGASLVLVMGIGATAVMISIIKRS